MTDQIQKSGNNSNNIQAKEVNINQGLTFSEAKEVALDVFRANFYDLVGKASEIASARAEEITENFLKKLQTDYPPGLNKAEDPSFQRALFTVQQEYASTGDQELGSLLVDLLVDRSKQEKRNILQIVLNESLNTAPKLTTDQLATLAIIFLLRYSVNFFNGTHNELGNYFDKNVLPFIDELNNNSSCYQHLEYAGCASISISQMSLPDILRNSYQGLFLKGITKDDIETRNFSFGLDSRFFIPCLNDFSVLQVKALNKDELEKKLKNIAVSDEDSNKLKELFNQNQMTDDEIKSKTISIRPYMEKLFSTWELSEIKNTTLTSVGIAIGHANIKRVSGGFSDLSIWIN